MPGISYLSRPYKPEPYIAPFDLSLMASVLSQEQGKFDQEGQKIQSQIDQFGSLDVIKGVDRDYLNNKINSLVTGLNDLGGVNLADQNVASKIEGMGSNIYGDKNIINAISSTKQIRNLQASYEKMKTDPKLSKQYSKTNEDWDNQFVAAYANDGKVGSSYSGPASASPYSPYRDNLVKIMSGMKGNMIPNITSDGVTFTTIHGKTITPQRVAQDSADLLLPDEKLQMEKDGWAAFRNANPLDVVQQSLNYNNQKLDDSKLLLQKYIAEAAASANDPVAQAAYMGEDGLIAQQRKEVAQFQTRNNEITKGGLQEYNKDPHGYMAQVYKDQFYRGMAERFASSEISAKITNNPMVLAQMKMQQQEDHFNRKMQANAIEHGWGYVTNPKTGEVILTGEKLDKTKPPKVPTGKDLATLPISDVNDPELYQKTQQGFIDQNKELDIKKATLFQESWFKYLNNHPDVSELMQSNQSGSGVDRKLTGQDLLEGLNGKPGLQIEDLNFDPNSTIVKQFESGYSAKTGKKVENIHQQILAIRKIYDDYDQMSNLTSKSTINPSKVDPEFTAMVDEYQMLEEQKDANNWKVKGISDKVSAEANLPEAKRNLYYDYQINPSKYSKEIYTSVGTTGGYGKKIVLDPRIEEILEDIQNAKVDERVLKNSYYQDISNRPVYNHLVFTEKDPLLEAGWLQNTISGAIEDKGSTDKKLGAGYTAAAKDIFPVSAGRNRANTGYAVKSNIKTGHNKETGMDVYESVEVDLTPEQAKQTGFNNDPYDALNQSVALKRSSNPLLIAAQGANGKTLVTKIRIVANSNDRSDLTSHAQLVVKTDKGVQYLDLPNIIGDTPSQVYQTMKAAVAQMAGQGLTLPLIVTQLLNHGK